MSEQNWKLGDVAIKTGHALPSVLVPKCPNTNHAEGPHWHHGDGGWDHLRKLGRLRRLVVIDPEDREQVARLLSIADSGSGDEWVYSTTQRIDVLTNALREYANPTPPKPEEPTGLGAVVEDAAGDHWVRHEPDTARGDTSHAWYPAGYVWHARRVAWADIDVVRVLSEGILPEVTP